MEDSEVCVKTKYWLLFIIYIVFSLYVVNAFSQTYIKGPALIEGVTSTATASSQTTLTKDSQTVQTFTGILNQVVQLPDATTLPVGRYFYITNRSTGQVQVNDGSAALLKTISTNFQGYFVLKNNGTVAGTWDVSNINITDVAGILPITNGGTGINGSSAANGNLLIGNGTGYSLAPIAGTANQVIVTNGSGTITLSLPQSIATTSTPTFASLTFTNPLTLANGGTNKSMTSSAGSVVYSDADSFELSAVGSSGQLLVSNATSAPSWSSISTLLDTTYFKQGGNSFSAAARLGTNDSNVLEFETNNTLIGTFSTAGHLAIGTTSPDASAKLDVQGTDGSILFPRLSTTNRNALTPTAGMQIYNTTTTQFECYIASWATCGFVNPMTTGGDIIYGGASGVPTRLANGSNGQFLTSSGGTSAPTWTTGLSNPLTTNGDIIYGVGSTPTRLAAGTAGQYLQTNGTAAPMWVSFVAPTVQRFTTGTGATYTLPTSPRTPLYIIVEALGPGGGGGGGGTGAPGAGANGTANTTFGTSLIVANAGGGGVSSIVSSNGTAGGTASITTSATVLKLVAISGGMGMGTQGFINAGGASGGESFFGGAGQSSTGMAGQAAAAETGSGGSGAGGVAAGGSASGGGAGGYAKALITSPSSTYTYTASGQGGAGGTAGTGGGSGGNGAGGVIIVTEYYQ